MTSSAAAVEETVRAEYPRILATLIRLTGDVSAAEDAVQDAVVKALQSWPSSGVPDQPRAWLTTVARRCAIDRARRESSRGGKEAEAVWMNEPDPPAPSASTVHDDLLRLVFTCCHPALSTEAQVALSLRTLCGLTTAEVAGALLVPEATMAKRLTRAKQKIAKAAIPYRVPPDDELPDRLDGVLATVYLVFNEGYAARGGTELVRQGLVDEAVRLGRLLHELMPDEAAVSGLLALMLLHDARRDTRVDAADQIVLLADQDRSRWNHAEIVEGVQLVGTALKRSADRPDPYVVQAAIASCHALAPTYEQTDWSAVISWYDVLLTVHDSPVVRLGRAAAIAERDGPAAGLADVDAISGLAGYPWWHASRAELLRRLGRPTEAAHAADQAAALGLSDPYLHRLRSDHSAATVPYGPRKDPYGTVAADGTHGGAIEPDGG